MDRLLKTVKIQINPSIYLKDPDSSELGKKIIKGSVEVIDKIGFEDFTFKKLAKHINSTEASLYRYFENKHKLLLYLNSWYWGWMEYRLVFGTANIKDKKEQLDIAITMICEGVTNSSAEYIDEVRLYNIIISDASKVYHTKEVDKENKEGVFVKYKMVVNRLSEIILAINPEYKYSQMLVSTMIEGIHNQKYFSRHLPSLTNIIDGEDAITEFYKQMVTKCIS